MLTVQSVLDAKGSLVRTIRSTAPVSEAVARMNEYGIGSLLVIEGKRSVVGIFTERDVLVRVVTGERPPNLVTVAEVMTEELVTISPHASVEAAMELMLSTRHRHLPVVEGSEILGLVSSGDLTRVMVREREVRISDLTYYITHG